MNPTERHLSREDLQLFLEGRLPPARALIAVRHLLTGCPRCQSASKQIAELFPSLLPREADLEDPETGSSL